MSDLVKYYKLLEEAIAVFPEYEQLRDSITATGAPDEFVDRFMKSFNVIFLALHPISAFATTQIKYRFAPEEFEAIAHRDCYQRYISYSADEVLGILHSIGKENALYLISKLANGSSKLNEALQTAYISNDYQALKGVLTNNDCDITAATPLCYYFSLHDAEKSINELENIRTDHDRDLFIEYGEDVAQKMGASKDVSSHIFVAFYDLMSRGERMSANEILEQLTIVAENSMTITKEVYYSILDSNLRQKEQQLLESITSRPEVSSYFDQWDKDYDDEKAKTRKQFHLGKQYENIFSEIQSGEHPEEYHGVSNSEYRDNKVFAKLLEYLVTEKYILKTDLPLFVFRMTGRMKPDYFGYSRVERIKWNGRASDLYFLCKELGPVEDRQKLLRFFEVDNEERFQGKYTPEPNFKTFLKSLALKDK